MILSIEFTSEYIYLAETSASGGKIKVGNFLKVPIPDGSYVNGIVSNTAAVAAAISATVKENRIRAKKVLVLVGGMDLMQKELFVPAGNEKQTRIMVEHELQRMGVMRQEYMFDYREKSSQKAEMQSIHAYLMQKALIQNYEATIRRAGLTPYQMDLTNIAMERLMKLLGLDTKNEMTILCCAEKDQCIFLFGGMDSKLVYRLVQTRQEDTIEENAFIVSAVQTLMSANNPLEKLVNIVIENVSKLVQFHMQKGDGAPIGSILMYGGMTENEELLARIETATGIKTARCPMPDCVESSSGDEPFEFLNIVGANAGMLPNLAEPKQVNFFKIARDKNKKQGVTRKDLIPLATGLVVVGCAAMIYPIVSLQNTKLQLQIAADEEYMQRPDIQEAYQAQLEIQDYTYALQAYNDTCASYIQSIQGARRLQGADFWTLSRVAGDNIQIKSCSFSTNSMTVSCETTSDTGASAFTKSLTDSKNYVDVKYQGYQESKNKDGQTVYTFSVECVLWGEGEAQQ